MAILNANRVGFINNSGDVSLNNNEYDIFLRRYDSEKIASFAGILEFNTSINDFLGINATSWGEIYLSDATISVKNRSNIPSSGYTLAINNSSSIGANFPITTKTAIYKEDYSVSTTDVGNITTFQLKDLFPLIPSSHSFKPGDSPWYIFIYYKNHENLTSTTFFQRMDNYKSSINLEGIIASNLHYNKETSWERCIPYYYDGTNWIQCQANYYDGNNWIKT